MLPSVDQEVLFHTNVVYDHNLRHLRCAGVCEFSRSGGCKIKLSEPLLKFRPTRDLKVRGQSRGKDVVMLARGHGTASSVETDLFLLYAQPVQP
jgi:hypothetical protein